MDIDKLKQHRISKANNKDESLAFSQSVGARMSAMEHLVPEQMFSTATDKAQGISAVKALAIASQQGQKIWTINQSNVNLALSRINLGADAEADIRNAVNAGKVATAHDARINFNGWIGEGYTLIDPNTGAGAYMISGGGNGGYVLGAVQGASLAIVLAIASFMTSPAILVSATAGALAVFWFAIFLIVAVNFYLLYKNSQMLSDDESACYLRGFFTFFGIAGLFGIPALLGRLLGMLGIGVGIGVSTSPATECF